VSKRLPVKGYIHDKLSAMLEEYLRNPPALDCLGTATNKGPGNTLGLRDLSSSRIATRSPDLVAGADLLHGLRSGFCILNRILRTKGHS